MIVISKPAGFEKLTPFQLRAWPITEIHGRLSASAKNQIMFWESGKYE